MKKFIRRVDKKIFLGFSLIGFFTFIYLIMLDLATPQVRYLNAEMRKTLSNFIKMCVVEEAMGNDPKFSIVKDKIRKNSGYKILKIENSNLKDTCYSVKAEPLISGGISRYGPAPWQYLDTRTTWFQIEYDPSNGVTKKSCGDASQNGCTDGYIWSKKVKTNLIQ